MAHEVRDGAELVLREKQRVAAIEAENAALKQQVADLQQANANLQGVITTLKAKPKVAPKAPPPPTTESTDAPRE